jgi:hypothetical protein
MYMEHMECLYKHVYIYVCVQERERESIFSILLPMQFKCKRLQISEDFLKRYKVY